MMVDKRTCEAAMAELKAAAQGIFEKYGLEVTDTRGKYGQALEVTVKAAVLVKGDNGVNLGTPEAAEYQMWAKSLGMDPDALGKTFVSGGEVYALSGYNRRRPRYPFSAIKLSTGGSYKFVDLKRHFPAPAPAEV
jgi:hypothetical protein